MVRSKSLAEVEASLRDAGAVGEIDIAGRGRDRRRTSAFQHAVPAGADRAGGDDRQIEAADPGLVGGVAAIDQPGRLDGKIALGVDHAAIVQATREPERETRPFEMAAGLLGQGSGI